jgi:hypothetical protein
VELKSLFAADIAGGQDDTAARVAVVDDPTAGLCRKVRNSTLVRSAKQKLLSKLTISFGVSRPTRCLLMF